MSTVDRESTNTPADGGAQLPIEDLSAAPLDAKTAEQVKGGLGQLLNHGSLSSSGSNASTPETSQ
jgi:hypothetical protein